MIYCPFCLKEHEVKKDKGKILCENVQTIEENREIPTGYIDAVKKGIPVYPIAISGYKGCGKSTYLSSLFYELYNNEKLKNWISLIELLNEKTIETITDKYIPILRRGEFLKGSDKIVFEQPLIVLLGIGNKKLLKKDANKSIILIIYDTVGGTFNNENKIVEDFPLIRNIPNIMLLIDLYKRKEIIDESKEQIELYSDMELNPFISRLSNAIKNLGVSPKKKNLIICFTKTDEFWDVEDAQAEKAKVDFGFLAEKPEKIRDNIEEYYEKVIIKSSETILGDSKIRKRYYHFLKIVTEEFGGYCFVKSSNVGSKPELDQKTKQFTFRNINPSGVVDPILWLLNCY